MESQMARDLRICFLGDSLTLGACDSACLGWPGRLSQMTTGWGVAVACYNLGIRRETTTGLAERIAGEVTRRFDGDFEKRIVISEGFNDTSTGGGRQRVGTEQSIRNMAEVLAWSHSVAKTLLIGLTADADPVRDQCNSELSAAFAGIAEGNGIDYIPLQDFTRSDPCWLSQAAANDGVHPLDKAYDAVAGHIFANPLWRTFID